MRLAGLSLKARIVIAAVAIIVVHLSFYTAPRKYASWPRFYPSAHAKAVSILRETFGSEAVDKGLVSILRSRVSIPYEGQAMAVVQYSLGAETIYVSLSSGCHVVFLGEGADRASAARLPAAEAREIAATLAYLMSARTDADCSFGDLSYQRAARFRLAGRKWLGLPRGSGRGNGLSGVNADSPSLSEMARTPLVSRFVDKLRKSPALILSTDSAVLTPALRAAIEVSLPPRDALDEQTLNNLVRDYARAAGKDALPLLKRIETLRSSEHSTLFEALRALGRVFMKGTGDSETADLPDVSLEIWAIETLEGKPDDERLEILTSIAFPMSPSAKQKAPRGPYSGSPEHEDFAAGYLAEKWPDKWKDLLVANYQFTGDKGEFLPPRGGARAGDARYIRLVAEDMAAPDRVWALAVLYDERKDEKTLAQVKELVKTEAAVHPDAAGMALGILFDAYARDRSVGDVPKLAREMLAGIKAPVATSSSAPLGATTGASPPQNAPAQASWGDLSNLADKIVDLMASSADEKSLGTLSDLVLDPENILSPGFAADKELALRESAARALCWVSPSMTRSVFLKFLSATDPAKSLESDLALVALEALADTGLPEDVGFLNGLPPRLETADETGLEESNVFGASVAAAVAMIEARAATDRVEYFRSADASAREPLEAWHLVRLFSADQLRALLADEKCADVRGRIIAALFWSDYRDHLPERCLECRGCDLVSQLF